MIFTRLATAAASVAVLLATGVQAQDNSNNGLDIYSPGGSDLWWVANSINVVSWTCTTSPFTNFSVILANQDPIKWAPFTVISIENNFDCSKTITADQQSAPAGTGYIVQFASTLNRTEIYASSEPFEIKPVGSVYPATTAVPPGASTASAGPSGSAGGSASASGSAGSAQNTQKPNGASKAAVSGVAAVAAAALGLFFA